MTRPAGPFEARLFECAMDLFRLFNAVTLFDPAHTCFAGDRPNDRWRICDERETAFLLSSIQFKDGLVRGPRTRDPPAIPRPSFQQPMLPCRMSPTARR